MTDIPRHAWQAIAACDAVKRAGERAIAPRPSAWRPIQTAPPDICVLVRSDDGIICSATLVVAGFNRDELRWQTDAQLASDEWFYFTPAEWTPIPD